MADAVSMQQVLAEAAVDELRFDEMQPLPEIWGQEAMSEPAGAGSPGLVRRRLGQDCATARVARCGTLAAPRCRGARGQAASGPQAASEWVGL